ncbi:MAG: AAA family ATPase [Caulobacteraceae bacterium]|nr:AAA family ATPase [Caulobacteraceae bacterium]
MLFGPSGCGKSFWGVHIGLSVALGNEVLGKKAKCAGVIYVAAEDAGGVQFRTVAWMQANHLDRDDFSPLPFAVVPEAPDLFSEENGDADALIAAIKREATALREIGAPPGLVIIDTYRDAMPGLEENDSRQTSTAVRTLRRIGEETDALVLVVAHTAKSGDGEDPRGSSALIGAADVALGVRLEEAPAVADAAPPWPAQRVLWVRKQRNGPDAKGDQALRWPYKLKTVDLDVIGEDGHPERSCVVEIDEMARAPRPVKAAPLKPGSRTLEQAIINLLSNRRDSGRLAIFPAQVIDKLSAERPNRRSDTSRHRRRERQKPD